MNRRNFLGGVLALAVTPALAKIPLTSLPTIVGDGVHDDWAGLQALLDGEPFRLLSEQVTASSGIIKNGTFLTSKTLHIRSSNFIIQGCNFVALKTFTDDIYMNIANEVNNGIMMYNIFETSDAKSIVTALNFESFNLSC